MLLIGGSALAILGASCVVAWWLWAVWRPPSEPPLPRDFGAQEVGMVNQAPFPLDTRAEEWRARQQARLHGYGWDDRDAGTIHIPIERAIEQLVSEQGQQGAGGGR
jgi:hypothetical protein